MAERIEDYGLLGDTQSAALVSRHGSVDWLCLPRFDSGACFAALLGDAEHGRWVLRPDAEIRSTRRRYRGPTLILETEYETTAGECRVLDFMPPRTAHAEIVRIVEGVAGSVPIRSDLSVRFDYGSAPWMRTVEARAIALAGPDALVLDADVENTVRNGGADARFLVEEGDAVAFTLTWFPSSEPIPPPREPARALEQTEKWWREWASRCRYEGPWRDAVLRSLITLKALTYSPIGGIVAAPTTSLPERLGGVRNWDYRYCWVRDATFTLYALLDAGYEDEASRGGTGCCGQSRAIRRTSS